MKERYFSFTPANRGITVRTEDNGVIRLSNGERQCSFKKKTIRNVYDAVQFLGFGKDRQYRNAILDYLFIEEAN